MLSHRDEGNVDGFIPECAFHSRPSDKITNKDDDDDDKNAIELVVQKRKAPPRAGALHLDRVWRGLEEFPRRPCN